MQRQQSLGVVRVIAGSLFVCCGLFGQQTSVTISPSAYSAILGHSLTLTATINPSSATGKVTFYDGVSLLGTQPLVSGRASFTTSLLSTGVHSLRAYYQGGGPYTASTSSALLLSISSLAANTFQVAGSYGTNSGATQIAMADFNGDGRADIVLTSYGSDVSVLLGNGDGTFKSQVNYTTSGTRMSSVAVGDFNGDGHPDLAVTTSSGTSILLGNGDGTFQGAATYSAGTTLGSVVVVGDFNGDGRPDLAVSNSFLNTVSVLLGNSDGSFQPPVSYTASFLFAFTPGLMLAADFNGDGKADLAVAAMGNGYGVSAGSILLGNGDGTFQSPLNFTANTTGPFAIAVGDFNSDGRADLVEANPGQESIGIRLGNGDGTFRPAVNYPTGSGPAHFWWATSTATAKRISPS